MARSAPLRLTVMLLVASVLTGCGDPSSAVDAGAVDASPEDAGLPDAGPPEEWEAFVAYQMEAGHLPGMALALIDGGELRWIGTYGYADVASERPVDAHSLFLVASISKTFTAMSLMQLVEGGALDLDAPADDYTNFAIRHPSYPELPITTRMLLTHSSGIVDRIIVLGLAGGEGDPSGSLADFARGFLVEGGEYYSPDNFGPEPGTERIYCNACFGILGAVFEGASERSASPESFREHDAARIFEPLGLDGAGWFLADIDTSRLATPHSYSRLEGFVPVVHQGFRYYPATSMHISVTGLSRYLLAFMSGGALDGARVLEESSVASMARIQDPAISDIQGLSWYRIPIDGRDYMGHGGTASGISAQMAYSAELGRGGVVLTNSNAGLESEVFGDQRGIEAIQAVFHRMLSDSPGIPGL